MCNEKNTNNYAALRISLDFDLSLPKTVANRTNWHAVDVDGYVRSSLFFPRSLGLPSGVTRRGH